MQVLWRQEGAVCQRRAGRQDGMGLRGAKGEIAHAGMFRPGINKAKVHVAIGHHRHNFGAGTDFHIDPRIGFLTEKRPQQRVQEPLGEGRRSRYAQDRGGIFRPPAHTLQPFKGQKNRLAFLVQCQGLGSWQQAPALPAEQVQPGSFLELVDGARNGGLGNAELFRSGCSLAIADHGSQDFQFTQGRAARGKGLILHDPMPFGYINSDDNNSLEY